ncbi:MAG: SHOCT domain-containing protein [Ignavibacteriae bacterium]|nr:SHOCT domain-containing protein [Ignavibacteriota bacterium]
MFHDGFMGGGMWFGWIFWIVLFVVIIWGVVKLANSNSNRGVGTNTSQSPLDVLKSRYAKGEITKAEFDSMKKDLE